MAASGRNLITKRPTYKCAVIPFFSPQTEEADVLLLQARLSTHHSPINLVWSCLSILWRCRPCSYVVALVYERNPWCPPCLIVCIRYIAVSRGQTKSASIAWQWHDEVPWHQRVYPLCSARTHWSFLPVREAHQLPRAFHLNAWIRFSIFSTSVHASHQYGMVESTIDLNSLNLIGKPMLLLNTLLSFAITAVAVAILMQISTLQVSSLDKVAPNLKFDTYWRVSPLIVHLALVFFLLFTMILDLFVLTAMMHTLALASIGFVRSCSSLLLPPSDICNLQNGGGKRDSHQLKWQCALRGGYHA